VSNLRVLPTERMADLVAGLAKNWRVFAPVRTGHTHTFGFIETADQMDLTYRSTEQSPLKRLLLPDGDSLVQYTQTTDGSGEYVYSLPERTYEPTVVLGVHPYDIKATEVTDAVFNDSASPDPGYVMRRKRTLIVGLDIVEPVPQSFAVDMGAHVVHTGFDLMLTKLPDMYLVEIGSEQGEQLVHQFAALFTESNEYYETERAAAREHTAHMYTERTNIPLEELGDLAMFAGRVPSLDESADACIGCTSCTTVCPTCVCFDTYEESSLNGCEGVTKRDMSSCLQCSFATVAGDHNFRQSLRRRKGHRYERKIFNMLIHYGVQGCVGCGRCTAACHALDSDGVPVASISNAIRKMAEQRNGEMQ